MFDIPLVLSALSFIGMTVIGYLNWRSGRFQPQVDLTNITQNMQKITEEALDGQRTLTDKITELEKHLKGSYEFKAVVRFYPKPEIEEMTLKLLAKRRERIDAR